MPRFLTPSSFLSRVALRRFSAVPESAAYSPINVTVDGRVATVALQSGGANVLTMDTVTALRDAWRGLEDTDSGVDAVVLTSARTGVVSGGCGVVWLL